MAQYIEALKKELMKTSVRGLIVCEKPSQAKAVREAYLAMKNKPCELDIIALHGHIMRMIEPAEYKPEWGKPWSKEVLPMIPEKFQYKVDDNSVKTFEELKTAIKSGKYDFVCNGCDADREGEAIFWNPVSYIGWKGPVYRLWNHDATAEAYQTALNSLLRYEKGSDLNNIRNASVFRGMMDWEIGMSGSRAVAMATNLQLPNKQAVAVGRVKTPVVAMVVARDKAIANFASAKYYEIMADFGNFSAKWFSEDTTNVDSKDKADKIVAASGTTGTVTEKTTTRKKVAAPQLYSLSELQKAASRKYGMTAQKVLDTVQSLYEAKLVSYPRTDARVLSTDKVPEVPKMLAAVSSVPELAESVKLVQAEQQRIANAAKDKRYFDNQKITAHHALVPTTQKADMANLTGDQKKIYMMIVSQFVGIFLDAYEYDETSVIVTMGGGQTYKASTSKQVLPGWKAVAEDVKEKTDDAEDTTRQDFLGVSKGNSVTATAVRPVEKATKAPAKYTDASLIADMTNCGKFATDAKIKAVLKDKGGLGTEATRAALIEDCIKKGLLTRSGKYIVSTEASQKLIEAMSGVDLVAPDLTAVWEMKLQDVEAGTLLPAEFKRLMEDYVKATTATLLALPRIVASDKESLGKCPICGGSVVEWPKTFSCEHNTKEHSCFVVFKETCGAKITAADVKKILAGKKTATKSFVSKAGKKFEAALALDGQKVGFVFENEEQSTATPKAEKPTAKAEPKPASTTVKRGDCCPHCGSPLKRVDKWIFCAKHNSKDPTSCPFYFSVEMDGVTLTDKDVQTIIAGKTTEMHEFTSRKNGTLFKAKVTVLNGKVQYTK